MTELLDLNRTLGASTLISTPPFNFGHVVMRVFPLRAEMRQLRHFCDKYLNISPFARFEPAMPYVYLQVINYGRLEPEAQNLGWVSQNEVLFNVPVNWYETTSKKDPGVFRDLATAAPFIFVDDESSIRMGREVYGWAKSLAELTPDVNEWAQHPRSRQVLLRLSAMVFPELFAGQRQELSTLIEIERQPAPTLAKLPLDPFNPLNPLLSWPKAVLEGSRMAAGLLEFAVGLPLRGYPEGRRLREPVSGILSDLNLLNRLPVASAVNLKQFRDCERPERICYQAITKSEMRIDAVYEGGLLGDLVQLQGDPTGGHRVRLHRFEAWPIIESLGLVVEEESSEGGHEVATLEPTFPFWADLDIHYGDSRVICSRTKRSPWVLGPSAEPQGAVSKTEPTDAPLYNTAEGGSFEQVSGPFHFPNVTYRVLPLLTKRSVTRGDPPTKFSKLQEFLDSYLNQIDKHRPDFGRVLPPGEEPSPPPEGGPHAYFQSWGSYVYLAALSFEEMSSESHDVGWWTERHVGFYIPVRWWKYQNKSWDLASVAMVLPYAFEDSEVAATTGREVQGWPSVRAAIDCPPSSWMEKEGPALRPRLLTVSTKVYPTSSVGAEMKERPLLEIFGHDILPYHDEEKWGTVAYEWGDRLASELRRKQGAAETIRSLAEETGEKADVVVGWLDELVKGLKAMSLEVLANREPINIIALKQFPAASDPANKACYQAITQISETIDWLRDLREIDERLHVAIHRYPTFPIVEALGLETKWTDRSQAAVIDYLQPIRPFWCRLDLKEDLGRELYWRTGDGTWQGRVSNHQEAGDDGRDAELPRPYFERSGPMGVGLRLVDLVEGVQKEAEPGERGASLPADAPLPPAGPSARPEGLKETTRRFRERVEEKGELEKEVDALKKSTKDGAGAVTKARDACMEAFKWDALKRENRRLYRVLYGPDEVAANKDRDQRLESSLLRDPFWVKHPAWRKKPPDLYGKVLTFRKLHAELELQNETLRQKEPRLKECKDWEALERWDGAMCVALTEPQQAIEGILSGGWGNQGRPPLRRRPPYLIRQDTIGHDATRKKFELEQKLVESDQDHWELPPGSGK